MQPPSGGLAPCLLVEVLQNARASLWRQCCLFSDRLVTAAIFYFDHPISGPKRGPRTLFAPVFSSTLIPPRCAFMISVTMASPSPATGLPPTTVNHDSPLYRV